MGAAGKGAAEAVNPTAEDAFWRENYRSRPYYESSYTYEQDYRPAYEYGWRTRGSYGGKSFDDVEPTLSSGWDTTKANSRLDWNKARFAARDAWDRLDVSRETMGTVGSPGAYPGHTSGQDEFDTFASTNRSRYRGRSFDDIENDLRTDWDNSHRGDANRTWERVKDNVRSAWHKLERAMPGDFDRDGR